MMFTVNMLLTSILYCDYTSDTMFRSAVNIRLNSGKAALLFNYVHLHQSYIYIDHFHKWRPIINSFVSIKINLTNLILKLIIQKSFYSQARLVRLIKINTKEF